MGYFRRSRASADTAVCGLIWQKFKLILDIMHVLLLSAKLKWVGSIETKKKSRHQFFRRLRAANLIVRCRI